MERSAGEVRQRRGNADLVWEVNDCHFCHVSGRRRVGAVCAARNCCSTLTGSVSRQAYSTDGAHAAASRTKQVCCVYTEFCLRRLELILRSVWMPFQLFSLLSCCSGFRRCGLCDTQVSRDLQHGGDSLIPREFSRPTRTHMTRERSLI